MPGTRPAGVFTTGSLQQLVHLHGASAQHGVLAGEAAGEGEPALPALERGDALLERGAGGVGRPGVLVALVPTDAVLGVRRGLVDRDDDCAGGRVGVLAGVDGQRLEPPAAAAPAVRTGSGGGVAVHLRAEVQAACRGDVVGVLLGFLIGSSRLAYAAVYPLMTAFNALPKAAFVPILVVWFGIGIGPAILTAFLISFFPIMVNIATGLATLEPELEDVLRVLGAKRWDVLVKVGLPRSMPYFYGSLKVAITLAFVGTTVERVVRPPGCRRWWRSRCPRRPTARRFSRSTSTTRRGRPPARPSRWACSIAWT